MRLHSAFFLVAVVVAALPTAASAIDGVLEINQTCVAVGCFAGDEPGFPVTIDRDQPGSYRLTSSLVNLDPDVSTIVIQDDHLTLDLNGFAVSGPTVCTGIGATLSCSPTSLAPAIDAFSPVVPVGVTIKNGVVRGSPSIAIRMAGSGHRIEGVHVVGNAGVGIDVGDKSVVERCRVIRNGGGIEVLGSGLVRGSVVIGNDGGSISSAGTLVVRTNVIRENAFAVSFGGGSGSLLTESAVTNNGSEAFLFGTDGYSQNVLRGNGSTGSQVTAGSEIGPNLCGSDTSCP